MLLAEEIALLQEIRALVQAIPADAAFNVSSAFLANPTWEGAVDLFENAQFQEVIAAYETAMREGKGAVQLDGKLVDPPVVERARQIVEWEKR